MNGGNKYLYNFEPINQTSNIYIQHNNLRTIDEGKANHHFPQQYLQYRGGFKVHWQIYSASLAAMLTVIGMCA